MTHDPLLDADCALVLIDLQVGITAMRTVAPADEIVSRAGRLAAAFRAHERPVVLVRTAFSAGGADLLTPRADVAPPPLTVTADFSVLRPELGAGPGDIVITKRQWDAFHGTELDLQLRRRGVGQIVLAGISTSIGVESTARQAFSLGYEIVFAADALTDLVSSAHENSLRTIFPRIGRLATSEQLCAELHAGRGGQAAAASAGAGV